MTTKGSSIVKVAVESCPKCGGTKFKYNPPEERKTYKGEIIIGKYTCSYCGEQLP